MAEALKIREDVVQSILTDGQRSLSLFRGSSLITESMAEAAGPRGPLRGTLGEAEKSWRLRRAKIEEVLEGLITTVRELNQAFSDIDDGFTKQFGETEGSADGGLSEGGSAGGGHLPSNGSRTGGESSDSPPQAESLPPLRGGGADSAQSGPYADPDVAEMPAAASTMPVPVPDLSPATGPRAQELVTEFVTRWAELTGRSEAEILALLAAGIGLTELVKLLKPDTGGTDNGPSDAGDGRSEGTGDGTAPEPGPGGDDSDQSSAVEPDVSEETDPDEPATGEDGPPEAVESQEDQSSLDSELVDSIVDEDAPVEQPTDRQADSAERPEMLADLEPNAEVGAGAGVDAGLPDLVPGGDGGGGAGSSAPLPELPPLDGSAEGGAGTASTNPSGGASAEFPDLQETSAPKTNGGEASVTELPELTTQTESRSSGAMPMMAGRMGMAGVGGGASSAPTEGSSGAGSGERQKHRRDITDVLGEEGRES